MSIRNLGDWTPLGQHKDPVHADPDEVAKAQQRYEHIADTIEDTTSRLKKIIDAGGDSLAGQYVAGLRSSASSLKDRLDKAAVRYRDVADEIKKYEPDLDRGLTETAGALADAHVARDTLAKAYAMPDPKKSPDGTIPPDEAQKGMDKHNAVSNGNSDLDKAKARLNNALDALNVAGKRFGDAVSARRYNDGLTDSWKDKLDAFMAKIARIFAYIGLALAALAILIPGVNAIVLAGIAAGVVSLTASIILYKDGKGSLVDVILGAVGLGLAGLGTLASTIGKGISQEAKNIASGLGGEGRGGGGGEIEMVPLRPPGAGGADAAGRPMPNFSKPFGPNNPGPSGTPTGGGRPVGPPVADGPLPAGVDGSSVAEGIPTPAGVADSAPAANVPRPGSGTPEPSWPVPSVPKTYGNPAFDWQNLSDWFHNPATNFIIGKLGGTTPDVGFFESAGIQLGDAWKLWGSLFTDPAKFGKDFASILGGVKGPLDLQGIASAAGMGNISPLWYVWGGLNGAFGFSGFIYTGGRLDHWIPSVNNRQGAAVATP